MLRVVVELHPFGKSAKKRTIATVEIGNTMCLGADGRHEYTWRAFSDKEPTPANDAFSKNKWCTEGVPEGYQVGRGLVYHNRNRGALALIRKVLENIP